MDRLTKTQIFTPSEKRSIYGLSGILFFRMFCIFILLPVFSVLAMDSLAWEDGLSLQKKFSLVGIAFGVYGLTQCLLQIPFGMLSDRLGRKKVIVIGLCLFIFGSILAAVTDSIYWMILARFLQGTGAISSTVFALIADLTRPEVRTRANAAIGISIGIAFASAFTIASFLADWIGLNGIFWLIAFLSGISMIFLLKMVPNPVKANTQPAHNSFLKMFKIVWEVPSLRTISWGGFVCGFGLSSTFFLIPLILVQNGIERTEMWKVYLPMILLGGITMLFASFLTDLRNFFKEVMIFGIVLMLLSLVFMGIGQQQGLVIFYIIALYVFFMGFNIFEPIFPSLVSRAATEDTKGTAVGVYNFAQFFGHFVGAAIAGILYVNYFVIFLLLLALAEIYFFYLTLSFTNPQKITKKV